MFETQLCIDHWTSLGGTKAQDTLAQGNLHLLQLGLNGSRKRVCLQAIQDNQESNVPPDHKINTYPVRDKVAKSENILFKELSLGKFRAGVAVNSGHSTRHLCRTPKYRNSRTSSTSS